MEPFDLLELESTLIQRILEKLPDFVTYVAMEMTSRDIRELCEKVKSPPIPIINAIFVNKKSVKLGINLDDSSPRIPWNVAAHSIPIIRANFLIFECNVHDSLMRKVLKMFKTRRTSVDQLVWKEKPLCSTNLLEELIYSLKITKFSCRQFLSKEFFQNPAIFERLVYLNLFDTGFTDEELLGMKLPIRRETRLINNLITARGINLFLKQWKTGEREGFGCLKFYFANPAFGLRPFDLILDGLDATPIWTPDHHEESFVGKLPPNEFMLANEMDPPHYYVLWRSENIKKRILLKLCLGEFEATDIAESYHETFLINSFLSDKQYDLIYNTK